jgi:hypothetical protein
VTTPEEPSRQTLEEIPSRVLTFLRALGTSIPIRAVLSEVGYTADVHAEGWTRLHAVAGYRDVAPTATENQDVRAAIAELDAWDEPGLRRIRAALDHHHPEQAAFVCGGLTASTGMAAVMVVATILDRLDALQSSPDRKKTRKEDHAALATLAKRGFTEPERERLRKLVEVAKGVETAKDAEGAAGDTTDARRKELMALRAWYIDWSETARAVIKRRDHLIRLGLAKRKKKEKGSPADESGSEGSGEGSG